MMLPFPRRVLCAIALASLSIWNRSPLNFSTDHLPFESMSKSKLPAVAVFETAKRKSTYFDHWYKERGLGRGNGGEHE